MMPLELSVSDATIWSITLKVINQNLRGIIYAHLCSFMLIYDVYSAGVTYDNHQLIIICLYMPQENADVIEDFGSHNETLILC